MSIPPLAGLCTYAQAAQVGYGVEDTVQFLLRYAWIEKRMMEIGLYWMNPTPEWELKTALSLQVYLDAEHAGIFRKRISEMRNPPPRLDESPDAQLDIFLDEVLLAQDTVEKIAGLYGFLKPELLDAYKDHYRHAHPLVDHPTRRALAMIIAEEEEAVTWGRAALESIIQTPEERNHAKEWTDHLRAYLHAVGGIAGQGDRSEIDLSTRRAQKPYEPDFFPRRDKRFLKQDIFDFPPHRVIRKERGVASEGFHTEEMNLALMCKRALEMDVPEMLARIIVMKKGQPWEFYTDMCRQLWDEARHAMMGEIYFETSGINWRAMIAIHPGFSIVNNIYHTSEEAHAALYLIEQGLMNRGTGKRYELEISQQAQDSLAALFQDFDWADEVLHVYIGRRWILEPSGMKRNEFVEYWTQRLEGEDEVLLNLIDSEKQMSWWPEFVYHVLGKKSALEV